MQGSMGLGKKLATRRNRSANASMSRERGATVFFVMHGTNTYGTPYPKLNPFGFGVALGVAFGVGFLRTMVWVPAAQG